MCGNKIHGLFNISDALHPPNPEEVFKIVFIIPGLFAVNTLRHLVVPAFENPWLFIKRLFRMDCKHIAVSITPAAPSVCPKYPLKLFNGIWFIPKRSNATDSISSL